MRNIEIKARCADLAAARAVVRRRGGHHHETVTQVDRYYALEGSRRLKLRTVPGRPAELIDYTRAEATGVRPSDYTITPVCEGDACRVPKTPPLVTVSKQREVWLTDNVRVHLDTVDELGTFLELEAVVDATHDDARCRAQVDELCAALGLASSDLVRASYAELLRVR